MVQVVVCTGSVQPHREAHSNEFNILLFTHRNDVHLQTICNKNRATIVIPRIFDLAWSLSQCFLET